MIYLPFSKVSYVKDLAGLLLWSEAVCQLLSPMAMSKCRITIYSAPHFVLSGFSLAHSTFRLLPPKVYYVATLLWLTVKPLCIYKIYVRTLSHTVQDGFILGDIVRFNRFLKCLHAEWVQSLECIISTTRVYDKDNLQLIRKKALYLWFERILLYMCTGVRFLLVTISLSHSLSPFHILLHNIPYLLSQ